MTIEADDKGFGFQLLGDKVRGPLLVARLVPGGAAALTGRLMPQDRIVAINGNDTRLIPQGLFISSCLWT